MKEHLTAEFSEARRITDKIVSRIDGIIESSDIKWIKAEKEMVSALAEEIKESRLSRQMAIEKLDREIATLKGVLQEIAKITPSTSYSHSLAESALSGSVACDRGKYVLCVEDLR